MSFARIARLTLAAFGLSIGAAATAHADELLTNGDFETGDLTGWTVSNSGSGAWYVDAPGSTTPLSAHSTIGGAAYGDYYAVTDQTGPGIHALYQSFTVAAGSQVILSFDMFRNDYDSGPLGTSLGAGSQICRVDIVNSIASPYDTGASVVSALITGIDGGVDPHGFTHYSFDISSVIAAGGTFWLRFGEADNFSYLNMGIDNVSLDLQAIPEPATLALFSLGAAGIAWRRRRKAARAA